jgi:cysteinyl-tRNA synthetase
MNRHTGPALPWRATPHGRPPLYDTLRREKVPFEPREEGKASVYVCGPTVQAEAHVGHGRLAVVTDVLRRYLAHRGHDVTFVQNVTDIDDKIILRARREQVDPAEISTRYTRAWNRAMDTLGVLAPDIQPYATGHLLEMQALIQELIDQDKAYAVDGDVFFRVRRFEGYGKLSRRRIDDMQQGEDVVDASKKEDPLDFAMWKAAKPGEPSWPSPWGDGRPGWHIECSAMAAKHLGEGFDIHCGGLDLVFPHHENEIAQHEAAHGGVFARHWVHNGMVRMGEDKMSKSLGNVISLEEAIGEWGVGAAAPVVPLRPAPHPADLRRRPAPRRRHRPPAVHDLPALRPPGRRRGDAGPGRGGAAPRGVPGRDGRRPQRTRGGRRPARARQRRQRPHHGRRQGRRGSARAAVAALADALVEVGDGVLGLALSPALDAAATLERQVGPLVEQLLERRIAARAEKDFATADAIRDQLATSGIVVEDRPDGPRWYVADASTGA